jgi:uncharacterized protein involved in exopolysaccharide biosynthesis
MAATLDRTIDLRHYTRLLWRRRGIILLSAVATVCAALIALEFIPKVFDSQVTLMVEENQQLSGQLQELMGGSMGSPSRFGADREQAAKLGAKIQSRPFLEQVIRATGLDKDPDIRKQAQDAARRAKHADVDEMATRILVEGLQSRINIAQPGPGIYRVTVSDYDATTAQTLARNITGLFVSVSKREALERLKAAHEFGKEQMAIYQEQLRISEEALESLDQTAIERTLRTDVVRQGNLVAAETLDRSVKDEVDRARMRLGPYADAVGRLGKDVDASRVMQDPQILELSQNLKSTLRRELTKRLAEEATEGAEWPPTGVISSLRLGLLEQVGVVAARLHPGESPQTLETLTRCVFSRIDLEAQQDASALLSGAIAEYQHQAKSQPGGALERARLEEEVATNRRLLQSFQSQLVASDVSQAAENTTLGLRIEVINPAPLPLQPSSPNRAKALFAALLLGPLLGAGIAFLTEVLDPVLRNLDDFSRIVPEPILGTTPLLTRLPSHRGWLRRNWLAVALAGVALLTLASFFAVRGGMFHPIQTIGVPVQVVKQGEALDANP